MRTYYLYTHPRYKDRIISDRPRVMAFLFPVLWCLAYRQWGLFFATLLGEIVLTFIFSVLLYSLGFGEGALPPRERENVTWFAGGLIAWLPIGALMLFISGARVRAWLEIRGFVCRASGQYRSKDAALAAWP